MSLRLYFLISLLIVLSPLSGWAQVIKGKVTDPHAQPIIGAHILNQSTTAHAHSDNQGNFSLNDVSIGDTLTVSSIGFSSAELVVTGFSDRMNVLLQPAIFSLKEVVIVPEANALSVLADIDLKINPVTSSQEVLTKVPGLFIGQHAGGGKAEQIFLRGFDIDHGTDITLSVDGMPVNMVSHAHGQGYADLHFLIPETIDNIDFGKGPYTASKGNFNTAGYVDFNTRSRIDRSMVKFERGSFNTNRFVSMIDLISEERHNGYMAAEYIASDGPFESPQNFQRTNLFGKYTATISDTDQLQFSGAYFTSEWDASGQIPERAVEQGIISRFGAIDDTEGGMTNRRHLLLSYKKNIDNQSFITNTAYFIDYDFNLFSNFTFFLNDPVNGDQIRQRENRKIFGWNSTFNQQLNSGTWDGLMTAGISIRNDFINDNELSRTKNRLEILKRVQLGNVRESNIGGFVDFQLNLGQWTINPAIRFDHFNFKYENALSSGFESLSNDQFILSPKLNVLYNPSHDLQIYLKLGKGFHSNDSRVVTTTSTEKFVPAAYGSDIGMIWKPNPRLFINTAFWYLFLEQEFVYVGDEGIVEPSGQTKRYGMDLSIRYQPVSWLFWNADATYTHSRSIDGGEGANFIPLAPRLTLTSGLNVIHPSGLVMGLDIRHLGNRPADETNSIIARGFTLVDTNVGYEWKAVYFGFQIRNVLNTEWNEAQFATLSRLTNEVEPVEEIHFTPGAPLSIQATFQYNF